MVWPRWECLMKPKVYIGQSATDEGDRKAQISVAGTDLFLVSVKLRL